MMRVYLLLTTLFISVSSSFALKVTDLSQIKGNEAEITEIDLSNSGLSEFPMEVLACTNLISLDLSENGIVKVPISLKNLEDLKVLDLSRNQGISFGDLGDVFAGATFRLEELDLSNCEIGFLPQEIGKLKSLKRLNIDGNLLNNLPYGMIQLTKLEDLSVANNRIEDMSWQVYQWWNLKTLDVSDNPNLKTEELLFSLSVCDGLDKLVVSHLKTIPNEFKDLKVGDLEIRNSHITSFNRLENSVPIKRLSFVKCTFQRPSKTAETINDYVQPEFISFNEISSADLVHFMGIHTDSVDIRNNNLTDISAIAGIRQLKWVDARGNYINERSITKIQTDRPDLELLLAEPVAPAVGINPPIEKFVKKPTVKSVSATSDNDVIMGSTAFSIKKNAFVDANGKAYSGEVQLAYTEYFSPADIFLSGITMTSDSAGENLGFSSAGMFRLTASDNAGNELSLDPNKPIDVTMLSSDASPDMNLYYLDKNGKWDFRGKDEIEEPFVLDQSKIDAAADSAFLNYQRKNIVVTEDRYVPIVEGDGDTRSFTIEFGELKTERTKKTVLVDETQCRVKRPTGATSYLSRTKLVYDGPLDSVRFYRNWFKDKKREAQKGYNKFRRNGGYKWGINYFSKIDLTVDRDKDRMLLDFTYKDSAVSIPVVLASNPSNPKSRIKVFQRFFKTYNREKRKDQLATNRRNRHAVILIKKEEQNIRNMARQREESRQRAIYYTEEYVSLIANKRSVARGFQMDGFGVWNCDQRSRMEAPAALPREFVDDNGERILVGGGKDYPVYVIDYNKNGVLSFSDKDNAFYDKKTRKMAIVIFFSTTIVGVYQSWKKYRDDRKINMRNMPVTVLDIADMEVEEFVGELEP